MGSGMLLLMLMLLVGRGDLVVQAFVEDDDTNARFDPYDFATNTKSCHVPDHQQSTNNDDLPPFATNTCRARNNDTTVDPTWWNATENAALLHELAVAHAPILYFHPLEVYSPASVHRTLNQDATNETPPPNDNDADKDDDELPARLYYGDDSLVEDSATPDGLQRTTRDRDWVLFSHSFYLTKTPPPQAKDEDDDDEPRNATAALLWWEYQRGDGFDKSTGTARAPLYFQVVDTGYDTVTIHYFVYFPWSGSSSFGVWTSLNGTSEYTRMTVSPWGVHEGDWQLLSVTLCNSPQVSRPLAVTYRQDEGRFGQVYDCTQGQCTFHQALDDNVTMSSFHPVGFVALHTHDVYAVAAEEIPYDQVWPLEFWVNLQGFYSVHRTAYYDNDDQNNDKDDDDVDDPNATTPPPPFRRFLPTPETLVRLPRNQEIPTAADPSEYWVAFGGRWYVRGYTQWP